MNSRQKLFKRVIPLFVLISVLCAMPQQRAGAQTNAGKVTRTLTGKVSTEGFMPEPLAGATVLNTRTNKGVITDSEGNYSIGVTGPDDILQFRFLGFKDVDIPAGKNSRLDVVMEDVSSTLEGTVVIGYGTTKKRDITGSIVSVTKDDIELMMPTNIYDVLQGSAAGVQVTSGSGQPVHNLHISCGRMRRKMEPHIFQQC